MNKKTQTKRKTKKKLPIDKQGFLKKVGAIITGKHRSYSVKKVKRSTTK